MYVDDIANMASSWKLVENIKSELARQFKTTDGGSLSFVLNMQAKWSSAGLELMQNSYIASLFERYGMEDSRTVQRPISQGSQQPADSEKLSPGTTQEASIGSKSNSVCCAGNQVTLILCYTDTESTPVGSTVVCETVLKHHLHYMNGIQEYRIHFAKGEELFLATNSDACCAGDLESARSATGSVVLHNGAVIE